MTGQPHWLRHLVRLEGSGGKNQEIETQRNYSLSTLYVVCSYNAVMMQSGGSASAT